MPPMPRFAIARDSTTRTPPASGIPVAGRTAMLRGRAAPPPHAGYSSRARSIPSAHSPGSWARTRCAPQRHRAPVSAAPTRHGSATSSLMPPVGWRTQTFRTFSSTEPPWSPAIGTASSAATSGHAIELDEHGNLAPMAPSCAGFLAVWTGTDVVGNLLSGYTCRSWTSTSAFGNQGEAQSASSTWTGACAGPNCGGMAALYCIEQ